MFLIFFLSLFVFRTIYTSIVRLSDEKFLSNKAQKTILIMIGTLFIVSARSFSGNFLIFWIFAVITVIVLRLLVHFALKHRTKRLKDNFCHLLDMLVLEVRSGNSFRASLKAVEESSDPFMRQNIIKIRENLMLNKPIRSNNKDFLIYASEFAEIAAQPHQALQRLQALRFRMKTISDFRHRSGKVTAQVRAQAILMFGAYFAVLILSWREYGQKLLQPELYLSMGLFSVGFGGLLMIGRFYKWKV